MYSTGLTYTFSLCVVTTSLEAKYLETNEMSGKPGIRCQVEKNSPSVGTVFFQTNVIQFDKGSS
jgi:hypothetical protein